LFFRPSWARAASPPVRSSPTETYHGRIASSILPSGDGEALSPDPGSVAVGTDDFAADDGAKRPPGRAVDGRLDEPDAPVAEQHVHATGVIAPGGDGRESGAADFLSLAVDVEVGGVGVADLLVRGPGRGEAGVVHAAVDPFGVAVGLGRAGGP